MHDLTADAEGAATSFLQLLKKATAAPHLRLESNSLLSAIVQPSVTPAQYAAYLVLMQAVECSYEQAVLPVLEHLPQMPPQRKTSALIETDLAIVATSPKLPLQMNQVPFAGKQLSLPAALGCMYVMKGSRLGGKVIYKNIQRSLGFSGAGGTAYLTDQGADTIARWKEFLAFLSSYAVSHRCEAEVIGGAAGCFESIDRFFESNTHLYEN